MSVVIQREEHTEGPDDGCSVDSHCYCCVGQFPCRGGQLNEKTDE